MLPYRTLNLHVLKHLLSLFLTVNVLVFVFFMGLRLLSMSHALLLGVSPSELLKLTVLLSPSFSYMLFPLSFYISSYMVSARMREDREVIALETLGFRIKKLFLPFMFFSLCVLFFMLLTFLSIEPRTSRAVKESINKMWGSFKLSFKKNSFLDIFHGAVMYVGEEKGGVLRDVFLNLRRRGKDVVVVAREGRLEPQGVGRYLLVLKDGHMEMAGKGGELEVVDFREMKLSMGVSKKFSPKKFFALKNKEMDIWTLREKAREALERGDREEAGELMSICYLKLAVILSIVPLSLVSFSIGSGRLPWSSISGVKALLGFLVLFYGSFSILQGHRFLPPQVLWILPDLFFTALGVFLLRRVRE